MERRRDKQNHLSTIERVLACVLAVIILSIPGLHRQAGAAPQSDHHENGHGAQTGPMGLDFTPTDEFDFVPPAAGSYRLPVIRPAADGKVLDIAGTTQSLRGLMGGKITLLSFIYTRCTDERGCPLATAVLYEISEASEVDRLLSKNLRMISLSFDPWYDTPEIMAEYRGDDASHGKNRAEWLDLTTKSEAELKPILKAYDQIVRRKKDQGGNPTDDFGHQLRAYLIDRGGHIRNIYGLGFLDPRLLVTDVYTLLMEEGMAQK